MTEFLAALPPAPASSLRPRNADDLGLRRALSDRLLPVLVASMVFLAALALGGAAAVRGLALHWQGGAGSTLTVQVPRPDEASATGETRAQAAGRALAVAAGVLSSRRLSSQEIDAVVSPWLGDGAQRLALALPAVFEVHVAGPAVAQTLVPRLRGAADGTLVEANGVWFDRLSAVTASLQACAVVVLGLVAFVAASVVGITTRAGLAARRDAIDIVHGLGATDSMIAGRFANRVTLLTFAGALLGILAALPILGGLAELAAPFQPGLPAGVPAVASHLPSGLLAALPALPFVAAAIGWTTAQVTVRSWLSALP